MKKDIETNKREPLNLEIYYEHKDDLLKESKDSTLRALIIKNTLSGIKTSIKEKTNFAHVCNISNLGLIINLNKKQYKESLKSIMTYFEGESDFEECIKIKALIKKLR